MKYLCNNFYNLRNTCRQQKVSDDYEKDLVRQE